MPEVDPRSFGKDRPKRQTAMAAFATDMAQSDTDSRADFF